MEIEGGDQELQAEPDPGSTALLSRAAVMDFAGGGGGDDVTGVDEVVGEPNVAGVSLVKQEYMAIFSYIHMCILVQWGRIYKTYVIYEININYNITNNQVSTRQHC